jgi:hypothetical protein
MRSVLIAVALLIAAPAVAQEQHPAPQPDYSRDALLNFVARDSIKMSPLPDHLPPGGIHWHIGWLEFHGLGMDWQVFYLPIAVPLAGSGLQNIARVPNPLEMAQPRIVGSTQLFGERSAAVNREMKRALKLQRQATKQ